VARLATFDGQRPHLVPLVFVVDADTLCSVVDAKPKRGPGLRRLNNVRSFSAVSALVDHYETPTCTNLWWVRVGRGRVLQADGREARHAVELLVQRYPAYRRQRPGDEVMPVDVERWTGWSGRS